MWKKLTGIAFFDLDKTLIAVNSAAKWFAHQRRESQINRWQMAYATATILLYELGLMDVDQLVRAAARAIRGHEEALLAERIVAFWHAEISHSVNPGARRAIAEHKQRGDKTVVLTSSTEYMARAAATQVGLDGVLAPRMVVAAGRFTGECEEPLCVGKGKASHARRFADAAGVPLSACTFYTDSHADLALLELVGNPVTVNPDGRLRRTAIKRGWPIADWTTA